MNIDIFLKILKEKLLITNDQDLADMIGTTFQTLKSYRNKEAITEIQMANLIIKAMNRKQIDSFQGAIKEIVEFHPINFTEARNGKDWKFICPDKDEYPEEYELKQKLNSCSEGIYLFYNSEGKVIYAGKTHSNLWKEMNNAFNRYRSSQKMYRVNHKRKNKDLKEESVKLHDIAHYFSVYETHELLTHDLEAFIIRAMPNNLTNIRMEKLK